METLSLQTVCDSAGESSDIPKNRGDTHILSSDVIVKDNSLRFVVINSSSDDIQLRMMGGCASSNTKKLYEDSEDFETEKLIHQGLSREEAKKQAHEVILKRKETDDLFVKNDREGREGEGPTFVLTEDDVVFENNTLNNMYAAQREQRPDEYNVSEHATVLEAFQSLRNGAKHTSHVVHHYNEKGELDIRDVVVLTYENNVGHMHVLNISQNGKNHTTLESAYNAMEERLQGFERRACKQVVTFVSSDQAVDPKSFFRDPREYLPPSSFDKEMQQERTERLQAYIPPAEDIHHVGPPYIQKDAYDTNHEHIVPVIRKKLVVDRERYDVSYRIPLFLQRLMGRDNSNKLIQQNKREKQNIKAFEKQKTTISKERKQNVSETRKAIVFVRETGVGIGGALCLLKSVEYRSFVHTKKERKVLRKLQQWEQLLHRKNEQKKKRTEQRAHRPKQKERFKKITKELRRPKELIRTEAKKTKERKKKLKKRKVLFVQKDQGLRVKEKRPVPKKALQFIRLLELFQKLTQKESKRMRKEKSKKAKKERITHEASVHKEQKKEVQACIREAFMLVILYALFSKHREFFPEHTKLQSEKKNESKREEVETPWMLLVIIWRLVMIREQGMAMILPVKKQKKKKKKRKKKNKKAAQKKNTQKYGVIYAFA